MDRLSIKLCHMEPRNLSSFFTMAPATITAAITAPCRREEQRERGKRNRRNEFIKFVNQKKKAMHFSSFLREKKKRIGLFSLLPVVANLREIKRFLLHLLLRDRSYDDDDDNKNDNNRASMTKIMTFETTTTTLTEATTLMITTTTTTTR